MVKNLSVVLDNMPQGGYPPGATISGRVIISTNDRIHIRSLTLKVQGEAEVSFTDFVTRRRRRIRTVRNNINSSTSTEVDVDSSREVERFTAHENYFTTSYQILGESDIPAGEQEFLFTTVLPPVLPSTFSGRFGFIRYTLKIKLDKAWNFDQVAKVEFRVVAPKDLNLVQLTSVGNHTLHTLADPLVYTGMKHFNCLCCKSGPLSLTVQLSKSGVVSGECIQLTIELNNASNVNISGINIILRQETIWYARNPRSNSKKTDEALLVIHSQGVSQRNSKSWYQSVNIPPIPYINIDVCSIIQLHHFIIVEAVADGMHTNLTVTAPIVVGTEPIGEPMRMPQPNRTYDPSYNPSQPGYGFGPPPTRDIGFDQPQPSAPVDFGDLPPPYPVSSQPYPPEDPPKKY